MTLRERWRLPICSALLYTLAFNLTFFIQELFLVVPKALTPGLRPTLFHNNHTWEGQHPLASLFQGTGALATVISGIVCLLLLRGDRVRSPTARLLLIWMAYHGIFQALPQVVMGAFIPGNDVGMAMDYFHMSKAAKWVAAVAALVAIAPIAARLARHLLGLSPSLLRVATVPAIAAIPLIVAFRVPREAIEVLLPPVLVTIVGLTAIHLTAWRVSSAIETRGPQPVSIAYPLVGVVALLLVFQLLLRPGVPFY
jgi:hypothetical protein